MLLQTNSYIVPKDKSAEHQRLIRRFRQTLKRLGCDHFEVYEQVGPNWSNSESSGRFVQILRFVDRKHQLSVQQAERADPTAQAVIADFCDLINFPYQQQQGLFAVGFYNSVLPVAPKRGVRGELISTVEHEVIDDPEAEVADPLRTAGPGPVASPFAGDLSAEIEADAAAELDAEAAVDPPPRRTMIDTVLVDSPVTSAGELHDVLQADAPVDHLEGTPSETETVDLDHVPGGTSAEKFDLADEDEHANGFVLEDAADGHPTDRKTW